jgi:antitoxin (DNA-binding transcriptional repressor) of toxin-antitoxin stability system
MQFVTVRDFRTFPAKIWEDLSKQGELIVTKNGKPIAILSPIQDGQFEKELKNIRRARAIQAINEMRETSFQNRNYKMTLDEINLEIKQARKNIQK